MELGSVAPMHQAIRLMIDPGDEPAARRAEGVLTERGRLDPASIDETRAGTWSRRSSLCEVRDQFNSVLGDAVKNGLYGRTRPNHDPR